MGKLAHADIMFVDPGACRNIGLGETYDLSEFFDRSSGLDRHGRHLVALPDALGGNNILRRQHSFFHRSNRHDDVINSIETQHVLLL